MNPGIVIFDPGTYNLRTTSYLPPASIFELLKNSRLLA